MTSERYYETGRRKTSIARVYLVPGTGKIMISRRNIENYPGLEVLRMTVHQPLIAAEANEKFGVCVSVIGGGMAGQTGAIRHGISRTLPEANRDYHPVLRKTDLLTRDPRMKERKKYGLGAARRAPQFSKQ